MLESPGSSPILSKSYRLVQSADVDRRIERVAPHADLAPLAVHLPLEERALVSWICQEGRTRAEVAAMLRTRPRRVGRRIVRIVGRMRTPEFGLCVMHAGRWPRDLRLVAERCVLGGRGIRRAALELGLSTHTVRRLREQIMAMARGARLAREYEARTSNGGDTWRGATRSVRAAHWRHSG